MKTNPPGGPRSHTEGRTEQIRRVAVAEDAQRNRGNAHETLTPGQDTQARGGTVRRISFGKVVAAAIAAIALGAVLWHGGGAKDDVPDSTKQAWAAAFAAAQPLHVAKVPDAEVAGAIAKMQLSPAQAEKLKAELEAGHTRLVYVTLWDTVAEDHDTVRIDSDFASQQITLMHGTATIAVPEPSSGVLNVTGIYDGGGGITVGMLSGGTRVNLPFMVVGQVLGVPVVTAP